MAPIFVDEDGTVDKAAGDAALAATGTKSCEGEWAREWDFTKMEQAAREAVMALYTSDSIWDEDVMCVNSAITEFK